MENNFNLPINSLPPEKPSVWESNPRLKTLLLVLIFVFLVCGIGLAVFAQWQNQYRQKLYDDTQAALPKHQPSAPTLKSFVSQTGSIQFQYPSNLIVTEANGIVTVNHNIPYENHGDCDMKGDSQTYPTLNDFNVAIQIVNNSVAQSVRQFSPYMPEENFSGQSLKISPGFIDQAEIGQYKGFAILEGVEGCGHIIYYFPIANNQTLVVIKDNVQMLSNIIVPEVRDAILKVPGVITLEQSDVIFKQIIGSLKLSSTSSQNDVSGWKTYRNDQYGFELRFPPNWAAMKVEDNGLYFDLPYSDTKNYSFVCGIQDYSQKQWDDLQNSEGPHPSEIIATDKDGYIYTYVCGQDDEGFIGFEKYNQIVAATHDRSGDGPYKEFREMVIPTFKFTK